MPISPILTAQATYPFVRLNEAAAARRAQGLEVIDFGTGVPTVEELARAAAILEDAL